MQDVNADVKGKVALFSVNPHLKHIVDPKRWVEGRLSKYRTLGG